MTQGEPILASREESGSIGIGAMIVFIALILVAAVASTIIIKTAEELQQNAENTSKDTRDQISGKVSIQDVFVKTVSDPMDADGDDDFATGVTDVATFEVIARVSSGSISVNEGDITWYITCKVTLDSGATYTTVDTDEVDSLALTDTGVVDSYDDGDEITAGTTFKFEIDLGVTDTDADDALTTDDFGAITPGCDAEAGAGSQLNMRIVVDGGGETLANLNIDSITIGKTVM
jgi:archaellin